MLQIFGYGGNLFILSQVLLPKENVSGKKKWLILEELIIKLLEYKKYKECSKMLADREKKWSGAHFKLPEVIPDIVAQEELEVSPETLRICMMSALRKYRDKMDDVSKKMKRILNQEKVSLRSKVKEILGFLKNGVRLCFSKLYNHKEKSRLKLLPDFGSIGSCQDRTSLNTSTC